MCYPGTPATTYVVYRWKDEDTYIHEHNCDTCADDIRHGAEAGELVLVWMSSLDDMGLVFSLPDRVSV